MKNVKIKERFEKVFEAFFEDAEEGSIYLEKTPDDEIAKESTPKTKAKNILKILRQIFLFFPATFFTFYSWMGMMIFGLHSPFALLILMIFPTLMVLGMGNIRNIRHWMMPLSVIILGSFIGIIMGNVPILRIFIQNFENAILFFPLALIAAVLTKNLADNLSEKK